MTAQKNELLNIPLEFKMACTIYDLPLPKVLQFFIDHVSFYDSLSNGFNGAYSNATNTMISCPGKTQSSNPDILPYREEIIKSIRGIIALTLSKGITETQKTEKSVPLINKLYKILSTDRTPQRNIQLDEENTLTLTVDFIIFCEIHHCPAKVYLEYFMSKISLADASARIGLNLLVENQAMAFFSKLSAGYGNLSPGRLPNTSVQHSFINEVQELHVKMLLVKDLALQRAIYHDLYYAHYQKLLKLSENKYEN